MKDITIFITEMAYNFPPIHFYAVAAGAVARCVEAFYNSTTLHVERSYAKELWRYIDES